MGEDAGGIPPSNGTGFAAAFTTMLWLFGALQTGALAIAQTTSAVTGKIKPRSKPKRSTRRAGTSRSVSSPQVTRATRR